MGPKGFFHKIMDFFMPRGPFFIKITDFFMPRGPFFIKIIDFFIPQGSKGSCLGPRGASQDPGVLLGSKGALIILIFLILINDHPINDHECAQKLF